MRKLLLIASLMLTSACTANMDTREAALTQARTVGAPQDCIRASDISHSRIRNDSTIDFVMRGQQVYRNVLPHGCPGLAAADKFSYSPTTNELCSVETIRVIENDGSPGPICGLGKFQRIELPFKS